MKASKIFLVWFGVLRVNLRLAPTVSFIDWMFRLSPRLRAA